MTERGKNIHLFLMDGKPYGRVKCTLANWTGVAYRIPRTKIEECKGRKELSQSGVYFLFGFSDTAEENVVYIGQAGTRKNGEGILNRLQEHKRNPEKDYWTEAVAFTTSNDSFGATEMCYLENRFTNMAKQANRYQVTNGNDPTPGNITEEKKSELEEFIDYSIIVMGTIGYKVFEPLTEVTSSDQATDTSDEADITLFTIERSYANATAKLTSEGLVVLKGSKIRVNAVPSCPSYAKKLREDKKKYISSNGVLKKDILFKTPSGASSFVLGASTNGNEVWRTKDKKTLKAVEASKSGF